MFRGALAVAGSQNAASWSLRAGISLAHLLRDTDRAPEARSVLVASVENLDATYPSADLARGLKLLREFEGHSVPSAVPRPVSGRPVRTSVTYRRAR
jgi:hypothetical protein